MPGQYFHFSLYPEDSERLQTGEPRGLAEIVRRILGLLCKEWVSGPSLDGGSNCLPYSGNYTVFRPMGTFPPSPRTGDIYFSKTFFKQKDTKQTSKQKPNQPNRQTQTHKTHINKNLSRTGEFGQQDANNLEGVPCSASEETLLELPL